MQIEVTPEPTEDERAAILAALAEAEPRLSAPPGPWLDTLGEDQEP